jgi:hypothetical protein
MDEGINKIYKVNVLHVLPMMPLKKKRSVHESIIDSATLFTFLTSKVVRYPINTDLANDESFQHVHLEDEVLHGVAQNEGERILKEGHDDVVFLQRAIVQPALQTAHIKILN